MKDVRWLDPRLQFELQCGSAWSWPWRLENWFYDITLALLDVFLRPLFPCHTSWLAALWLRVHFNLAEILSGRPAMGTVSFWPVSLGWSISVNIQKSEDRSSLNWPPEKFFPLYIFSSRQGVKWGCTKFKLDCGMTCPKWPDQVCRVVVLVLTSCRVLSSRISFSHPCTVDSACACAFPL